MLNLFVSDRVDVPYIKGESIKVGMRAKPMSKCSMYASISNRPVMSNAYKAAIKLITESFAGVSTRPYSNGVYVEGPDGFNFYATEDEVSFVNDVPESLLAKIIPVMCYMISADNSDFSEFQGAYVSVRDAFLAGNLIDAEDAYFLCDSFYFTFVNHYGKASEINVSGNFAEEMLKQLGRSIKDPMYVHFSESKVPSFKNIKIEALKNKEKTKVNKKFIEKAKNGDMRISYAWGKSSEEKIPSLNELDLFIPSEDYEDATMLIKGQLEKILTRIDAGENEMQAIGNNAVNLIFTGKPGTGKSTVGRAIATTLGLPFYCVPINKNAEEDEFQGKTKLGEEGSFKFCETPFLEAFMHGGVVMLEEFNLANPAVIMGVLGQAIEKPYVLYRDGYEPVYRHPLCVVIATCNTMTQGAQKTNEAFVSRCPATFVLNDPSDKEFIDILSSQETDVEIDVVKRVYKAFKEVINYLETNNYEDLMTCVTLRHCLGALRLIGSGIDEKRAVKKSIVNVLALDSLEIADEVYENVIDNMFD